MNSSVILFEDLLKSSTFNDLLGEEVLSTLRCPVCMDYFKDPIALVCGHTFCYGCLYDMSMHMKSRMMNVHIRNVRIHCPNCRVPVHVQGIIQKRCTTNFTLASFLESLDDVKVPVKSFSEASTNTDPEEKETTNETNYDYDETLLNKMDTEIDNAISSLSGGAGIIHDSWIEINKLRKVLLNPSNEDLCANPQSASKKGEHFDAKGVGNVRNVPTADVTHSLQSQDPAILMTSVDVSRRNF